MDCRCCFKAFGVILLHFKVDKMNREVIFKKKLLFARMGTPTLEKPGFPGIPRKFSSLTLLRTSGALGHQERNKEIPRKTLYIAIHWKALLEYVDGTITFLDIFF
jgi:hypothetical protein